MNRSFKKLHNRVFTPIYILFLQLPFNSTAHFILRHHIPIFSICLKVYILDLINWEKFFFSTLNSHESIFVKFELYEVPRSFIKSWDIRHFKSIWDSNSGNHIMCYQIILHATYELVSFLRNVVIQNFFINLYFL